MQEPQPVISPFTGLRIDGRRQEELRKVSCRLGGFPGDGSAVFQIGNTHVIASVYGPREAKKRAGGLESGKATITCEFSMSAFSSADRHGSNKRDKRSLSVASMLRRLLESVVLLDALDSRSELRVVVTVLHADGATRCAAINAVSLALAHAGVPMRDLPVAATAALVASKPLTPATALQWNEDEEEGYNNGGSEISQALSQHVYLVDPCRKELTQWSSSESAELHVAIMLHSGHVAVCEMEARVDQRTFPELLKKATSAASLVGDHMRMALNNYAKNLQNHTQLYETLLKEPKKAIE